jgi:hypothetical protein
MNSLKYLLLLSLSAVLAMAQPTRPKDLPAAASPAGDDKIVLDGTTNGTRALAATYFQPLDADLTALAASAGSGFPVRTGSSTWAFRDLTGTAGEIDITNPTGVAGNPVISLPTTITQATTFSNPTNQFGNVSEASSVTINSNNISILSLKDAGGTPREWYLQTSGNSFSIYDVTSALTGLSIAPATGEVSIPVRLALGTHTTAAGGVGFGSDTNLYRVSAGTVELSSASAGNHGITVITSSTGTPEISFRRNGTAAGNSIVSVGQNSTEGYVFVNTSGFPLSFYTSGAKRGSFGSSGELNLLSTTSSTSTTTGAVTIAGGVGVSGAGYFGAGVSVGGFGTAPTNGLGVLGAVVASGNLTTGSNSTISSSAGALSIQPGGSASDLNLNGGASGRVVAGTSFRGNAEDIAFTWDASAADRIGIVKKTASVPKFAHGSTTAFTIARSSTSAVLPSSTYTDELTISTTGDVAIASTTDATTGGAGSINTAGGIYSNKKIVANIGFQVGGANSTATDLIASATGTLDFGSIAAAASADLTITVTGASTGDSVHLGLPAAPTAGIVFNGFVSATNTITVRATNITGSPVDPASATYRATVISF